MTQMTVRLLIALTVVSLAVGFADRPQLAEGWSLEAHPAIAERVIRWLEEKQWAFDGAVIDAEAWAEVEERAQKVDEYAFANWDRKENLPGQLVPSEPKKWGYHVAYHNVASKNKDYWDVYPDEKSGRCAALWRDLGCPGSQWCWPWSQPPAGYDCYSADRGAEDFAPAWATLARARFDMYRGLSCEWWNLVCKANKMLSLEEARRYAGYAIHYAQDAVNPPHVDPWATSFTCGGLVLNPHTFWEANDTGWLEKYGDELDLTPKERFPAGEADSRLREKIVRFANETDAEWPEPSNVSDWGMYDPFADRVRQGGCDPLQVDFDKEIRTDDPGTKMANNEKIENALNRAALLTKDILVYVFDLEPPGGWPPGSTPNVDVALVIDSSGSMTWNDPTNERKKAARTYVTGASVDSDQVAVVDFDHSIRLASPLRHIPEGRADLLAAIDTIDSSGNTDIGGGLQKACDELKTADPSRKKGAILLTDGVQTEGDYLDQHLCFQQQGWPVYVFSLGTDIDPVLLQRIADDTGGEYTPLPTANLICEFQRVRALMAGVQPPPCQPQHILPGETIQHLANVPAGQAQATFSVNWPGSTVRVTLIPPLGLPPIKCDAPPAGVTCDRGDTFVVYRLQNPAPGEWIIELYGEVLPPEGEDLVIGVTTVPAPDTVSPTTDISVTGTKGAGGSYLSPVTVTLSAADNEGGKGLDWTAYSLDEGDTWQWFFNDTDATPFVNQFQVSGNFAGEVWAISADWAEPPNIEDPPAKLPLRVASAPPPAPITPTPTCTPTPSPTPTPTPTPTPRALPTASVAGSMVAGWNDRCYVGGEKSIEDALAGIASKVLAVYRLNTSSQKFDGWFPGRSDPSNMTTLKPYDQLFILMSADGTWVQEPSTVQQPSVSLAQGWNSICYAGQQKATADATSGIAGEFGILYMLTQSQSWAKYVPGSPDSSDIAELKPYDSVLVLVTKQGGTVWTFDP